jgi:hypothetical protein
MKIKKRENLNYYLEELVWYNVCMKKGKVKILPVFEKGKSMITTRKDFRVMKSYQILNYFHKEKKIEIKCLSSRRKLWRIEGELSSREAERWLVYYLDKFFRFTNLKGLRVRTFEISNSWIFLFKEIGELRIPELYFDFFYWNSTWTIKLQSSELEKEVYSSLKIRYEIFNRKRL